MRRPDLRSGIAASLLALAVAVPLQAGAEVAPTEAAQETVGGIVEQVLAILRDKELSKEAQREKLESVAYARFDFDVISKLVLAKNWRKLTPEQRDDFVVEFKRHLSLTYGKNLEGYKDETVEILGARPEKNGDVTVQTRIIGSGAGADPILIDYRLRRNDSGEWLVIDLIIERVSLLWNFRSQIDEIIGDAGPENLIDRLREKNAAREAS